MALRDGLQRFHLLVTHHSWEIRTPRDHDIGLQTIIQLDGDVLMRLTPDALRQPELCQAHLTQVQRALTALRWLRRTLAWGSTVGAVVLSVPTATMLWRQTQGALGRTCAGTLLGLWVGKWGLECLGRLYVRRLLRRAVRGGLAENRG